MSATLTLDDAEFQATAARLVRLAEGDLRKEMRSQARIATVEAMKMLPPFDSIGGARRESFGFQRRIGQQAVSRDIERTFQPIADLEVVKAPKDEALNKRLKTLMRARNVHGLAQVLRNLGIRFQGVAEEAEARIHQGSRDRRGRPRPGRGWKIVKGRSIASYLRQVKRRVGYAKAGFARAAIGLGARVPAWVLAHGAPGMFFEARDMIVIENRVNYVSFAARRLRVMDRVIEFRRHAMATRLKYLERKLAREARR